MWTSGSLCWLPGKRYGNQVEGITSEYTGRYPGTAVR